jgi:hypothetical protein
MTTIEAEGADPDTFIPIRPICEQLGLNWIDELALIKEDPVLEPHLRIGIGQAWLRLRRVNFWVFTINTERLADPVIRERVIAYQEECLAVLDAHFRSFRQREEGLL